MQHDVKFQKAAGFADGLRFRKAMFGANPGAIDGRAQGQKAIASRAIAGLGKFEGHEAA